MHLRREPGVVNLVRVLLRRHGWGGPWGVNAIDIIVTEERRKTYHRREVIKAFQTACIRDYV